MHQIEGLGSDLVATVERILDLDAALILAELATIEQEQYLIVKDELT
jgi:hypothetical protein